MKTVGEWIDAVDEITNSLQNDAEKRYQEEIKRAANYCDGYVQGCKDFARAMSQAISNAQG